MLNFIAIHPSMFICNTLTTVHDIQDYASWDTVFLHQSYIVSLSLGALYAGGVSNLRFSTNRDVSASENRKITNKHKGHERKVI